LLDYEVTVWCEFLTDHTGSQFSRLTYFHVRIIRNAFP
jgi:hypothetical protein